MEQIDLSEIQELLDDILGGTVDFQQLVEQGTSGQSILSWGGILHDFGTIFLQELVMQKRLWVHVLLLAVASAVLLHFAEVFKNRSVSQISFAMIYMILLLILMVSFQNSMEIARDVLLAMRNFMTVLAPAYFLAMTMTSYVASAGVYYEFILLLVSGLQRVLELFVLPCIEIYVLLVMGGTVKPSDRIVGNGGGLESERSGGCSHGVSYDPGTVDSSGGCISEADRQQRNRDDPGDWGCGKFRHRYGAWISYVD